MSGQFAAHPMGGALSYGNFNSNKFRIGNYIFDKNGGAKEQTAKDLGIDRKTLYRKLKEMNLN